MSFTKIIRAAATLCAAAVLACGPAERTPDPDPISPRALDGGGGSAEGAAPDGGGESAAVAAPTGSGQPAGVAAADAGGSVEAAAPTEDAAPSRDAESAEVVASAGGPAPGGADGAPGGAGASNAGGNRLVGVMTRNLYVGADLFAPFRPVDPLPPEEVWARILASDPLARAEAVAGEIAAARPDLVGLQEAYRFVVTPLGGTEPVQVVDVLAAVEEELAELHLPYRVVAAQSQTTLAVDLPALGVQVTITDRDAILADADVLVRATDGGTFIHRQELDLGGRTVELVRGWVAAEVRHQGLSFTFVNTHLEVRDFGPIQAIQALELLRRFGGVEHVALVGDLNSDPGDPAFPSPLDPGKTIPTPYQSLATAFADAWAAVGDGPGLTCCFDEDLAPPSRELSERIDHVLVGGALSPRAAERVGLDPLEALGGRWPSDHAGVAATLRLEEAGRPGRR